MNRRALLASSGSALTAATAGCLSGRSVDLSDGDIPSPSGECGTLAQPQSERFIDDDEDSSCHDGAMTSLAVANERDEEITIEVAIEPRIVDGEETDNSGGKDDEEPEEDGSFAETYALPPDERAVGDYAIAAALVDRYKLLRWPDGDPHPEREPAPEPDPEYEQPQSGGFDPEAGRARSHGRLRIIDTYERLLEADDTAAAELRHACLANENPQKTAQQLRQTVLGK